MLYTINELGQKLFSKIYDVYETFKDFFGEEYVDLQKPMTDMLVKAELLHNDIHFHNDSCELSDEQYETLKRGLRDTYFTILVWWPEVTVTNEHDMSVQIQDLFARIRVNTEGNIPFESTFELTRSTLTEMQYRSGYLHSHLPRMHTNLPLFGQPCLGTGPIKSTIYELHTHNDEPLWMLFCQELSIYVTVESLMGVPYIRLENIGKDNGYPLTFEGLFSKTDLKGDFQKLLETYHVNEPDMKLLLEEFVPYYLQNGNLQLTYMKGKYVCGLDEYQYLIDISNAFIKWLNECCTAVVRKSAQDSGILKKVVIRENKIYTFSNRNASISSVSNTPILIFKGREVLFRVIHSDAEAERTSFIIDLLLASFIILRILDIINYHYNHEHITNNSAAGESSSATTSQKVLYI